MTKKSLLERLELVVVGDELLTGRVVDTNSAFIGRLLASVGAGPSLVSKVGDDEAEIRQVISAAMGRSQFVIVLGGLGPTDDDRTIAAVAALLGRRLRVHAPTLRRIEVLFAKRGLEMPEPARRQALLPIGAKLLQNPFGMVPGMILTEQSCTIALVPGVPEEMEAVIVGGVLPYLRRHYQLQPRQSVTVRTIGLPESAILRKASGLTQMYPSATWAYYPSVSGVDVVVSGPSTRIVTSCVRRLQQLLDTSVYAVGDDPLEAVVGRQLKQRQLWLATAESCTGGLVSHRITNVPGSSCYFRGGVIAYSNEVKLKLLGVPADVLRRYGAVSEPTVRAMATGAMRLLGADTAVAVSGIAGPGGGTRQKPVGLVFVAAAAGEEVVVERLRLLGDRRMIKERAAAAALDLLRRLLLSFK